MTTNQFLIKMMDPWGYGAESWLELRNGLGMRVGERKVVHTFHDINHPGRLMTIEKDLTWKLPRRTAFRLCWGQGDYTFWEGHDFYEAEIITIDYFEMRTS